MARGSLYSASDKAIFDALNQTKVTNADLKEIFLSRGIILSKDTQRQRLAKYFSRLVHDYNDYQLLSRILGTNSRREKTTLSKITSEVEIEDVELAAHELATKIASYGDNAEVSRTGDKIEIRVTYQKTSFSKSEFSQVVDKEAIILIEKDGDEILIRSPLNLDVEEWKATLLSELEKSLDMEVDVEEISLDHITDSTIRTLFFTKLIENLNGFTLHDVSDVYVFHAKEDQEEQDEPDDDDENLDHFKVSHIDKASLRGQAVLQSSELKDLFDKGFYISKIVWKSKRTGHADSDIYEFEAQFADPENCSLFSYIPKGFYRYKNVNEYNKTRVALTSKEESEINKTIEDSAQLTIDQLLEQVNESADEDEVA